ncbi:MAG: ABC transporter permease [Proteobacteria bacterium]|nr:ABC transporter permease [Pseudomonadota bacterium]
MRDCSVVHLRDRQPVGRSAICGLESADPIRIEVGAVWRLKTFYLLIFNLAVLLGFLPGVFRDPVGYGLFSALTVALAALLVKIRVAQKADSRFKSAGAVMWRKLNRNKNAMVGMVVLIVLIYLALLATFISPYDPLEIDWGAMSLGASGQHWLGTDDMGRDIFSRNLFGIRVAIGIGVTAVVLNTLIGSVLGMIAGYYGGKIDNLIMRLLEIWNSIPFILLAIAIMAALGTGIGKLIVIVSLSNLMAFARLIRGSVLLVKETDFIAAAKVIGLPNPAILLRHVLPNCVSPILVLASLSIGETILVIAGLSFLGLGIQPPMPSLGAMLSSGQQYLHENLLMSIVPGTTILLIVLSFNLFGDGVRDSLDTKLTD